MTYAGDVALSRLIRAAGSTALDAVRILLASQTPRDSGATRDRRARPPNRLDERALFYLDYYDIENYLFSKVHERFRQDGYLCAFDFFSIVRWKSNRTSGMIREALRARCPDLDQAVKSLTGDIHEVADHENRLKILLGVRGIGLPIATAILTVLYPDHFTVYDSRVCRQLGRFSNLGGRTNATIWEGYEEFRQAVREEAVRRGAPESRGLRDMDRWLWTLDVVDQLKREGCTPPSSTQAQSRSMPTMSRAERPAVG